VNYRKHFINKNVFDAYYLCGNQATIQMSEVSKIKKKERNTFIHQGKNDNKDIYTVTKNICILNKCCSF